MEHEPAGWGPQIEIVPRRNEGNAKGLQVLTCNDQVLEAAAQAIPPDFSFEDFLSEFMLRMVSDPHPDESFSAREVDKTISYLDSETQ